MWNENISPLSCHGEIKCVKNWLNVPISNFKPDLYNNKAHIKLSENPLRFTQVIVLKQKYVCVLGR